MAVLRIACGSQQRDLSMVLLQQTDTCQGLLRIGLCQLLAQTLDKGIEAMLPILVEPDTQGA